MSIDQNQDTEARRSSAIGGVVCSRKRWSRAYRNARVILQTVGKDSEALAKLDGILWKAMTILLWKRSAADPLGISCKGRLQAHKIIESWE